jgi:hypothetical protein
MLARSFQYATKSPWLVVSPGVMIFLTVLSNFLLADGIRDALDPRISWRQIDTRSRSSTLPPLHDSGEGVFPRDPSTSIRLRSAPLRTGSSLPAGISPARDDG